MLQVQCLRIFVGSACMMLLQLEGRGFRDDVPWAWPRNSGTLSSMKLN